MHKCMPFMPLSRLLPGDLKWIRLLFFAVLKSSLYDSFKKCWNLNLPHSLNQSSLVISLDVLSDDVGCGKATQADVCIFYVHFHECRTLLPYGVICLLTVTCCLNLQNFTIWKMLLISNHTNYFSFWVLHSNLQSCGAGGTSDTTFHFLKYSTKYSTRIMFEWPVTDML